MFRQIAILLCLVTLVGCAPRGTLLLMPGTAPGTEERKVFMATTRRPVPGAEFSARRVAAVSYGEYDISVPPLRKPGEVSHPRREPDPQRDFITRSARSFDRAPAFTAALSQELGRHAPGKRSAVIFVHGFNTTFAEGLYRSAQLSHDFGIEGVTLHYSWPSAASPFGYAHDRDSALFARTGFDAFLNAVIAAGPDEVLILAHSMGALLTMETLRQMALEQPGRVARDVDGLVLFSPDIDVDVFRSQVRDIGRMPKNVVLFTSQRDRALALSARLSGQPDRLGNIRSVTELADLDITVLDVTQFSRGLGHFTPGSSSDLIRLLRDVPNLERSFNAGAQARPGLLPGTVITVRNATEIVLMPFTALAGGTP